MDEYLDARIQEALAEKQRKDSSHESLFSKIMKRAEPPKEEDTPQEKPKKKVHLPVVGQKPLEEQISEDIQGDAGPIDYSALSTLAQSIDEKSSDYFHSAVLARVQDPLTQGTIDYDLRKVTLAAALAGLDLLMTGNTGCGKTMYANRMAIALYGSDGYVEKTVTPGTREADFTDLRIDTMTKGGTLAESIEAPDVLKKPCVVINELNRMPQVIQNKLISFFDKSYEYLGAKFKVGHEHGKKRYQFRIVTINEGTKFGGTAKIDAAVRDRMIVEIPMDYFPLTRQDEKNKNDSEAKTLDEIADATNHIDTILALGAQLKSIPMTVEAERFMQYLPGLNNCVKSNTGSKMGVDMKALKMNSCTGCHLIQPDNHVCNAVYAPSSRALSKVKNLAQAFALIKSYTLHERQQKGQAITPLEQDMVREPVVTTQDLLAAAPFVFYSKMNVDPMWVQKHHQGNRWEAVKSTIGLAYERFSKFLDADPGLAERYFELHQLRPEEKQKLTEYAKREDAWAYKIK